MSDFDPDKFLAETAFDPDAFLAETTPPLKVDAMPTLGAGTTGLAHFQRHLAFGLGDKINAFFQSIGDKLHDKTGKKFGDIYDNNLAFNDRLLERSDEAHPVAKWVGNGLGFAGNVAATAALAPARAALAARGVVPAAAKAVVAPTIAGRALQGALEGAKVGGTLGAVGGYGAARGDNTALGIGLGGTLGALTGGTLGAGGGTVAGILAKRAQGKTIPAATATEVAKEAGLDIPVLAKGVTPDPEAQVLQKYGVPLTLGQMQPGSIVSEAEEAALRVPVLKGQVAAQRAAAEQGWRDAVINEARAPVEGPVGPGSAIEKLERLKGDFRQAYGEIADKAAGPAATHHETGEVVSPREALEAILGDATYQAGNDDQAIVQRIFENELGKLERAQAAGQPIKAGLLQDIRSGLREAAQRARLQPGGNARAQMFQDAAESIGGGLRATLPEDAVKLLKRTDAAYSKFMRVVDAAYNARQHAEEGEFGPKQLSQALAKAYGKRLATDSEAGGSLRELSRAGKYAFTNRDPLTGHGDKLKAGFGLSVGSQVERANRDPALQTAFMLAAQRSDALGGPRTIPPAAGPFGQAVSRALEDMPRGAVLDPEVAALVAALRAGPGGQR